MTSLVNCSDSRCFKWNKTFWSVCCWKVDYILADCKWEDKTGLDNLYSASGKYYPNLHKKLTGLSNEHVPPLDKLLGNLTSLQSKRTNQHEFLFTFPLLYLVEVIIRSSKYASSLWIDSQSETWFLGPFLSARQNISMAAKRDCSNYLIVQAVPFFLIYGLVSVADLIYNEVSPPLPHTCENMNLNYVAPVQLFFCRWHWQCASTKSCHRSFHLIRIIWSISFDGPTTPLTITIGMWPFSLAYIFL